MIVYRLTDRIPVKIGEVTFWISPLSHEQKITLMGFLRVRAGEEIQDSLRAAAYALKVSVKAVDGLTLADGSKYELSHEGNALTDDCVAELTQLTGADKLVAACAALANSIREHKIEGVEIDLKGVRTLSQKKTEPSA